MSTSGMSVQACIDRWVEAESSNDLRLVEDLVADDLMMVGPAGFVLDRSQWLVRFDQ